MKNLLPSKWGIALRVAPFAFGVIAVKLVFHQFRFEPLSLSPLFNSLIAATVFLLGFLLTGTLTDYKESEKLPGELAGGLETIYDEFAITHKNKNTKITRDALRHLQNFTESLIEWFHKKERTTNILRKLTEFNDYFLEFEKTYTAEFYRKAQAGTKCFETKYLKNSHNSRNFICISRIRGCRNYNFSFNYRIYFCQN